jgi:diguanylate cyclase (GGDEF)-like protein
VPLRRRGVRGPPAGVDSGEAALTADRLRGAVASSVTPVGGTLVQVTVSIGVAAADPATTARTDVQELLARADLGLYRAKTDGRNQVRLLVRPDRRTNVAEPD